jgi:hypothetical protein
LDHFAVREGEVLALLFLISIEKQEQKKHEELNRGNGGRRMKRLDCDDRKDRRFSW